MLIFSLINYYSNIYLFFILNTLFNMIDHIYCNLSFIVYCYTDMKNLRIAKKNPSKVLKIL